MKRLLAIALFLLLASVWVFAPIIIRPIDSGAWVPTDLAGLKIWTRPEGHSGLSQGDAVRGWIDESGNGYFMTNSVDWNSPVYHTNLIAGYDGIALDGDKLTNVVHTLSNAQPFAVVMVVYPTNVTGFQTVWKAGNANRYHRITSIAHNLSGFGASLSGGDWVQDWQIASCFLNGSASFIRTNRVQTAFGSAGTLGMEGFVLGDSIKGYIAECLVYQGITSNDIVNLIEPYLTTKYDLASPAWEPTDLAGLEVWLKPESLADDFIDGDDIDTWQDDSGNGYDMTQSTAGNRPTNKVAVLNGYNVAEFGGGASTDGDQLHNYAVTNSQPFTHFIVFKRQTGGEGTIEYITSCSSASFNILRYGGTYRIWAGTNLETSSTNAVGEWMVLTTQWNGVSSQILTNGVLALAGNAGTGGCDRFLLNNIHSSNHMKAQIAEVLYYAPTNALSSNDLWQGYSYLKDKFDL